MACNKHKNKQWQDITYVRTLAKALSLSAKSDVTIYKTYERGLGDVYCFDIFKKGSEPTTTVEIIRYEPIKAIKPIEVTQLQHDSDGVVLSDIRGTRLSTPITEEAKEVKPKKSGRNRK